MSGRILVTGAGGYIGSAIVTHLAEKNLKVRAFGHDTRFAELSRLASGDVDFHPGELLDADSLAGALDGVEDVVHTASFAGERACRADIPAAIRTIVRGTRLLVEQSRLAGVERFVHLSTYAVYSTFATRAMPLSETSELLPDDLYGSLKAEAEWEAARANAAILRLTNVFGPGSGLVVKTDVMGHFRNAVDAQTPIKTQGGGRQAIEFVHIDDVCRVVAGLVVADRDAPLVLNVGSGQATPIRELALLFQATAREILGRDIEIVDTPAVGDKTWPDRVTTIEKAKNLFPWFPEKSLADGVREIIRTIQG